MSFQLHNKVNVFLLNRLKNNNILLCSIRSCVSSREPQTILVQRNCEVPIVTITEKNNVDMIGPPDSLSNLRPIMRKRNINETVLQSKLRSLQDETQAWNQKFWAEHNITFIKEKNDYVKSKSKLKDEIITADEMSEFYKRFLDKNWSKHVNYNIEWYKRNLTILLLSLRVSIYDILRFS